MAKILVFSDSHAGLSFMRHCIKKVQPDAIVHLGDYYDDGQTVAEEFSYIPFHAVPGNCDKYRLLRPVPEVLCYEVCGVRLFTDIPTVPSVAACRTECGCSIPAPAALLEAVPA